MSLQFEKRLFSVQEFHKMVESGILRENDRVELIDGEIFKIAPIGSRHAAFVEFVRDILQTLIKQPVLIRVQNPVVLNDYSEPQPDIAIIKYRKDYYITAHPKPADILLIIEVAETSVEYDREIKIPKYAESLISESWILNIPDQMLEIYKTPQNNKYAETIYLNQNEKVRPVNFNNIEIPVKDFFIMS